MNSTDRPVVVPPLRPQSDLEEAVVRLHVSLPPVEISVSQARALQRGVIVDLGIRLSETRVQVSLEGELIGEGTMGLVGRHAAVRLLPKQP